MSYISNYLTHWIGSKEADDAVRYQILTEKILKEKALLYNYNDIPFRSKYGGIQRHAWGVDMICFTDIPFSEVEEHCKKYSRFGISFSKAYLANSCVVPVWYTLSPFVYEAYSYLYHSVHGLQSLVDNKIIPEGKYINQKFTIHKYLQKLHAFIAFFQDYDNEEFTFVERTLSANEQQKDFFQKKGNHYFEREWRSVYRRGDSYSWNKEIDGRPHFLFLEESVTCIIVPEKFLENLKKDINNFFKPENVPNLFAYEELKHL
jgi:hypothetical protein